MQRIILLSIIALFGSCTKNQDQNKEKAIVEFNQELANELAQMVEVDQTAAWIPEGRFKEYSREEWQAYKDSVFTTNKKRAEEMFNEHGYPGFDLVGEQGSFDFWLIVQHCDFDPEFQKQVLLAMETQISKENANKRNFAYLTDRVNKNMGKKLIYGTQVTYNRFGQAIPQSLEDSANVDVRRADVGLEPLVDYLNRMTESHWEMNKENMINRGITEPKLHETAR
ncbi:MAG: DUF6624 domain-containing protein [Reichenbachiella sp.]|uniref:DUF6624 domain-containing protein n=1 Tax=Reichenbachiella sp. TaxID=2184521 RepID=UPI003296ED63